MTLYLHTSWCCNFLEVKETIYCSIIIQYAVAALVVKEGISIKSMLKEFSLFTISTMTLFCDNQCCIKLANNPKMSDNIRHVSFKHNFL